MTTDSEILLVRTLAAFEAPWFPIRTRWEQCPAIYHARRRGLRVGGGNVAERQRICRQRDELTAAGLIVGAILTAKGRRVARGLSWPYSPTDLKRVLDRIKKAIERGDYFAYNGLQLVPDDVIAPERGSDGVCQGTMAQRCLLPLLADGLVISRGDPLGQVAYALSETNMSTAAIVKAAVDSSAEWREELAEAYDDEIVRCLRRMAGDENRYSELGEVPICFDQLVSGKWWFEAKPRALFG